MTNNAQNEFISKAKKEIEQRIKTETKTLKLLNTEKKELINAIQGYKNYHHELEHFIEDNAKDFKTTPEELPEYFKSNINDVYQSYVQIKQDAKEEIQTLQKYITHCKKETNTNQRTLKFYRSQYMDSDFFDECLPLVQIYQEKIEIYQENITLTEKTIKELEKIEKELEKWK
ncbi:hypothetical protein PXD04_07200 [Methanosphaera sp. ISO3-F5]|uniref:hypothetical protein n=1 Tax=Methanosphaera sp. ISO3-F5 TaxID=1452353 RepID=UPI002B25F88C|nr:hypothetical protein [Methanosphaera sp. ISO3-F5]WQH63489.1 hypothetical protein PXD04_07200 [Methanosphaera sp. ISO3-F5]